MAPPHPQTATVTGDQNIVVQNTGSHVVIQVGTQRLQAYTHQQYLSGYRSDGERGLLIAQLQGIPFYLPPREPDLLHLRDWLDSPNTISIRTLLGRAGTGKTRTAIEFVNREQSREDWNFGWLSGDELQRFIEHASLAGKIWTGNVCLILDYASASVDSLKKLLQQGLIHAQAGPGKLRLLLLDRSDSGWYASLLPLGHQQDAVKALFAGNDPRRLPSFVDVEHRRALLASALTHFRALKSQSDLTLPAPGEDPLFDQRLKNAEPWGDPLFLILAAAASAQLGLNRALSMSRTELARFAAGHEANRLIQILPGAPLHHMVALITLAGGASSTEAREAIKSERERLGWSIAAADLLERLKTALPGPDSSRLGKVEPDIIGEAFILDFLKAIPGDETDFLQAARSIDAAGTGQTLVHTIQNFALGAGAQVTATESTEQAERARRADEESLLIRLLSEYVERCSASENDTLWTILDAIPVTSTTMSTLALSICDHLTLLVPADDFHQGVRLLNRRALRLAAVGRWTEALSLSHRETEIFRKFTTEQPEIFRPLLAGVLSNYGNRLIALGKRPEGLSVITESVNIYKELATAQPEVYRPDLAMALSNQVPHLSGGGDQSAALAASAEACDLFEDLAQAQPEVFRPRLATSLSNQSNVLRELGQLGRSAVTSSRALDIRRELATAQPETFSPDLANSLHSHANVLIELERFEEAIAASTEAINIFRQLATANSETSLAELANSLTTRASALSNSSLDEDALSDMSPAIRIHRSLAETFPEAFRPHYANSLGKLANILKRLGRCSEALKAISDAVHIYSELASEEPTAFLAELARAVRVNDFETLRSGD